MAIRQSSIDAGFGTRFRELSLAIVAAAAAAGLNGCGGADVEFASVEGMVMLDGQPVQGAAVMFLPLDGGPSASGSTDAKGQFRLASANRPGAPLGEHRVLITKTERPGLPRRTDERVAEQQLIDVSESQLSETIHHLPARYANAATTELRATVEAGKENRFTFSLTSDDTVDGDQATPEVEAPDNSDPAG